MARKMEFGYTNDDDVGEPCAHSDDELPDESIQDYLSWRKEDSFSDWTIIITVTKPCVGLFSIEESKVITYNVHKTAMAIGPRRSGYFARLFGNDGRFSESQDNTSRIELNELQAMAFPDLLDYIYMPCRKERVFTTLNATPLYSLAKYFDVRRLRHETKKFFLQDMSKSTCSTYYEHAKILQEDDIQEAAALCFREHIQNVKIMHGMYDVKVMPRMYEVTDTQFWLEVMEEQVEKGTISNVSNSLSVYIAGFCRFRFALSPEVFRQLTDEKYLGDGGIDSEAAIVLLDLERRILGNDKQLSSLQIRCVNAIVRGKKRARLTDWYATEFENLSPIVLREIITRAIYGIPAHQQPVVMRPW
jgi:BTB/POZ domain